jgi:hypothetical protein
VSTATKQADTSGQAGPAHAQSSTALPQTAVQVVVNDAGTEIHGYVVALEGKHVRVVWAVASGRHRHRTFPAERVFLPDNGRRWEGYLIPDGQLAVIRHAALCPRRTGAA